MFKIILISLFSVALYADIHARFESTEHSMAGDQVRLSLPGKLLHLQNGLILSFGDIVAMGDFYGVIGAPISQGENPSERQTRFIAAFNALAEKVDSVEEASRIITAIHTEKETVLNGIKQGRLPEDVYTELADEQLKTWNCLTGGACSGITWWLSPGRYLLLAKQDFDHFGDNAIAAYMTGHEVALKTATQGQLEQAYAMEAFACHFLTDRFSSGHMRVPRVELPGEVTPGLLGSFLATFMHDEESAYGLHVHNQRGDHWVAYGDRYYLDSRNQRNLVIMQEALQVSVDQVYQAFLTKQIPGNPEQILLLPQVDESGGSNTKQDIAPMFYWDSNTNLLMRRLNLRDPYDAEWTSDWFGWSTLALLKGVENISALDVLDMAELRPIDL